MLMPRDILCAVCLSVRIQICYRGSLWQDVMVGLEGELDALLLLMKIEMQIEMRGCMYTVRRCLDDRIFDQSEIGERISAL